MFFVVIISHNQPQLFDHRSVLLFSIYITLKTKALQWANVVLFSGIMSNHETELPLNSVCMQGKKQSDS